VNAIFGITFGPTSNPSAGKVVMFAGAFVGVRERSNRDQKLRAQWRVGAGSKRKLLPARSGRRLARKSDGPASLKIEVGCEKNPSCTDEFWLLRRFYT
jgi:hypothetical protein